MAFKNLAFLCLISLFPFIGCAKNLVQPERSIVYRQEPPVSGDSKCSSLMCIGAIVNGSNVEYVLQSTGLQKAGWMAMGFGTEMVGVPMVIMWTNSNGNITISQRKADMEALPSVDSSPPRIASLSTSLCSTSGKQPKLAYTVPKDSDDKPNVIWAFGTDSPSSSNVDATFRMHISNGKFSLDLTKSAPNSTFLTSPVLSSTQSKKSENVIFAHALFSATGFLVILPAGVFLARFYRTKSPKWFTGHWILQSSIGGLFIATGAVLSNLISRNGGPDVSNFHTRCGATLYMLFGIQVGLGAVIHYVKPKASKRRPPQNYLHAVLGLLIIGGALYQVRTGYKKEWPNAVGRVAPKYINILWYAWVVLLPVLYTAGLSLLPRQFAQERNDRFVALGDESHVELYVHNDHDEASNKT